MVTIKPIRLIGDNFITPKISYLTLASPPPILLRARHILFLILHTVAVIAETVCGTRGEDGGGGSVVVVAHSHAVLHANAHPDAAAVARGRSPAENVLLLLSNRGFI